MITMSDVISHLESVGVLNKRIPANPDAGDSDYDSKEYDPPYYVNTKNIVDYLFDCLAIHTENDSETAKFFLDILSRDSRDECIRCLSYVACAKDMPEEHKIYRSEHENN